MNLSMQTERAPMVAQPTAMPLGPPSRAITAPVKHPALRAPPADSHSTSS